MVFALATSDLLDYGDCLFLDTIERAFDICRTVCYLPNDKGHYVWEKDSEISSFEYLQILSLHFRNMGDFFCPNYLHWIKLLFLFCYIWTPLSVRLKFYCLVVKQI